VITLSGQHGSNVSMWIAMFSALDFADGLPGKYFDRYSHKQLSGKK
jgi:hypothetical protein